MEGGRAAIREHSYAVYSALQQWLTEERHRYINCLLLRCRSSICHLLWGLRVDRQFGPKGQGRKPQAGVVLPQNAITAAFCLLVMTFPVLCL